jgi:methionine-rich copper-binding protein CopC
VRNVVLTASLALGLLILGSVPAAAHASLVGADPEDGSTHATAPERITLTFSENIGDPAFVVVTAPDGEPVPVSDATALDNTVTADVTDVDKRGTYTASYRVVSADGHPVEGTLSYTVTTGAVVEEKAGPVAQQQDFLHRHRGHFFWGILAAVVAVGLLLAPLRRRDDQDHA